MAGLEGMADPTPGVPPAFGLGLLITYIVLIQTNELAHGYSCNWFRCMTFEGTYKNFCKKSAIKLMGYLPRMLFVRVQFSI